MNPVLWSKLFEVQHSVGCSISKIRIAVMENATYETLIYGFFFA